MKIVEYHTFYNDDRLELSKEVNEKIKEGWQPLGGIFVWSMHNNSSEFYFWQTMVKYETEKTYLNMPPETVSYFEKLEDDDLSKLKFKLYVSEKSIESYQKENEQLKEKILFYESPLSEGELTYDELIKKNKRLETIIEILVSNHCQELVSGETVMYFSGNLIKENGDSFEDDIYNIARKIIEKK